MCFSIWVATVVANFGFAGLLSRLKTRSTVAEITVVGKQNVHMALGMFQNMFFLSCTRQHKKRWLRHSVIGRIDLLVTRSDWLRV